MDEKDEDGLNGWRWIKVGEKGWKWIKLFNLDENLAKNWKPKN